MAKAKYLHFTCRKVDIETHTASLVSVTVEEPNLSDILDGIHGDDLRNWTRNHKSPDALFESPEVVKWVNDSLTPGEVFGNDELEAWAEANGFVKEAS
jgi:hypothetical protein